MSLRWRLMLSVGAVVLASLAAVAYVSSRVVRVELNQLTHMALDVSPAARQDAARAVGAYYQLHGLEGMQAHLAKTRDARFPRSELLFLDDRQRLLASSAPISANVEIERDPRGMTRIRFGAANARSELVVRGGMMDVSASDGRTVGSLLLAPRWKPAPTRDPMRAVNRWLLLAVAVVGAAALGFTALVARRVIAPIERLQEAAARVRGGALNARVAVTSRDEVGQLAEAFNAMTGRLQQHEELRRNLVNDVAHELRTPLTNLRASIESIQDGLRKPDGHVIDALHDDVLLLQRLVEDLQTLALAEAGKLPLHIERVELRDELERVVRTVADPRVHLAVAGNPPASVDRVRLQQILSNLIRNALAHVAPDGRVAIQAASYGSSVRITVTDDGTGIAPADLPHIFDRFYRADASRTRSTGGAGLGLAIARELVHLHGGTIHAESDAGTRFTIELPA